MLNHKNEKLLKALGDDKTRPVKVAGHAGTSVPTARKVIAGGDDVNIGTLVKIADYCGLDVEISYKQRAKEAVA